MPDATSTNPTVPWPPVGPPIPSTDGGHSSRLDTPHSANQPANATEESLQGAAPAAAADTEHRREPHLDPRLVDQTRDQIRQLVEEISGLAKSACEPAAFYEGFLTRATTALACIGGAFWTRESPQHPLELQYQINLSRTELANNTDAQLRHHGLLTQFLQNPEPKLVPPHSGGGTETAGNPTPFLLILAPLVVERETVGMVEILQRPGGGPATQRGYLRFVMQMADIASEYLTSYRLKQLAHQQRLWRELDQFTREIHAQLHSGATASAVANEGRRVIECDRLTVAWMNGGNATIAAVSGLDSIERRADQLKRLAAVVGRVARTGQTLWFEGNDEDLPPQINEPLQSYLDCSHTRSLAIVPLRRETPGQAQTSPGNRPVSDRRPFAALIVEQLAEPTFSSVQRDRIELVTHHAASALANAREHNSIFGLKLWKALGSLCRLFIGPKRYVALTTVTCLVAAVVGLAVVPYPFALPGQGELVATVQRDVFAPLDGTLIEIHQPRDATELVRTGQPLAKMVNNDIAVEIEKLEGQLKRAEEEVRKFENAQSASKLEHIDRITIEGELAKARSSAESTRLELALVRQQAELLTVLSPIDGHVINWQLKRVLLGRPVTRGQKLMTVIAHNTEWQVELFLPEKRVGHLLAAMADSSEPLQVTFSLVSRPDQELTGRVVEVDHNLEVVGDHGNACRVLISFDNSDAPHDLFRAGTRVVGKIHCGQRSIGFVWFHELIDTVRTGIRFWL